MTRWAHKHVMTWRGFSFGVMALGFWFYVAPMLVPHVIQPEWWLDVRTIIVSDATVGQSPAVVIDREIRRDYVGGFESTVRKVDEADGTIWSYCPPGHRNEIPYRAGIPYTGRDLDWWLGTPPADRCELVAGRYLLRIDWTIPILNGLIDLHMRRESAPFTISPHAYAPPIPQELTGN